MRNVSACVPVALACGDQLQHVYRPEGSAIRSGVLLLTGKIYSMWSGSTDRVRRILHRRSRTKQIHAIGGQVGYRQGRTQPELDETGPHKQPSYQLL